ncbi:MAG: putative DNA binding domain-containing protein [Acholeplasmatales bacterium]|nr:putative DNA binding domain-containing protein [Acholeplasmatales bacterium]
MKEENSKVEWKLILTKETKEEIISFLNSGDGIILVGVDDNGNEKGVAEELKDEYDQTISNWIREGIFPDTKNLIKYEYNKNNTLVISIKEGPNKPYYSVGKGPTSEGVYIRIGSTKRKATKEEIMEFFRKSSDGLYETDTSDNQNLHFTQFLEICDRQGFKPKLKTLGFYTKDNTYSKLAELMSDENTRIVKFAVYKDETRVEFKIKKEFSGSYLRIIDSLIYYAELHNDVSAKIVDYQPQRVELLSFPKPSLRESILNSLCHCDLSVKSNIKVEFFTNRVEITSPGNIYGGYSLEDILSGKQSFRNPNLINLLDKLDFIENYATGLERTLDAYKKYEYKPKFEVSNNFFRVVLPNLNYYASNEFQKVEPKDINNFSKDAQLSNIQIKIVELIRKKQNISIQELSDSTGKDRSTILRNIKKLKELNILNRDGTKWSGNWILL